MAAGQEAHEIRRYAEEVVLAVRSDPATAEQLLLKIDSLVGQTHNPVFEAFSQRAKGHLLHVRGDLTEAVRRYRTALTLFEQCQDKVERARTASTLVGALVPLGEYEEALRLAEQARQVFQEANLHNRVARLDVNVGNLYHRLNRLEEALQSYERAAVFLENSDDYEAAAGVLINRSVILMLLYRFNDALEGLNRARAFSEKHGLTVFAIQSDYNRGYLLFLMGEVAQAFKLLDSVEEAFENIGDRVHVALCRLDRAEILLKLNLPEYACELARSAEDIFRNCALNGDRARAFLLIGRGVLQSGATLEALGHYKEAKRLFQVQGNVIWAAVADLEIAAGLMESRKWSEAESLAEEVGELFRSHHHLTFSALADALSARLCIERKNPDRALSFLRRCEESLRHQPPAWLRFHLEHLRGRALQQQGRPEDARERFIAATEALEFLLTQISVDQAMVCFLEDKEEVYERLACVSEDVRQAFESADRARTLALSTTWNAHDAPKETSDKVQHLRETLRSDYLRLFQVGERQPLSLLEKIKAIEYQLAQELLERDFRRAEPARFQGYPRTVDLADDEVLLEYFLKESTVSVFILRNDALQWLNLPISTTELWQEVNFTRYGLFRATDPRREPALRHHLRRLFDALIGPLLPLLRKRVVIVPHRFLHQLPFHALLSPSGYLADEYVVSYAPSAASYESLRGDRAVSSCTSLAVGMEASDVPGIRSELAVVADKLPNCTVSINQRLENFRPVLEKAAFVHIACHSVFRADNPACSLLSLGSDVLTPMDILEVPIQADLVTISGCSTARVCVRGSEIQGFVRAFSMWGVRSLIASLWDVSDDATSKLMHSFYGRIQDSPDLAENLRSAMLDVRREFEHPYYWSGFILIGRQKLGASWCCFKNSFRESNCTERSNDNT